MTTRTGIIAIIISLFFLAPAYSQDRVIETIEQAEAFYHQGNLQETARQLTKALLTINDQLLEKLTGSLPEPFGGWRADDAHGATTTMSKISGLKAKRRYYKKGGGSSVDIEIVTNSIKIGNIKMLFSSPSMVKRAGGNIKISTVADRKCVERFDPIDNYAELIFVPTSTLLITITGQDIKNSDIVKKYAKKMKWDDLEITFP